MKDPVIVCLRYMRRVFWALLVIIALMLYSHVAKADSFPITIGINVPICDTPDEILQLHSFVEEGIDATEILKAIPGCGVTTRSTEAMLTPVAQLTIKGDVVVLVMLEWTSGIQFSYQVLKKGTSS